MNKELRHYYRFYGTLDLVDITPYATVNKILKDFGTKERVSVKSDYHMDVSSLRILTEEEANKIAKVKTDTWNPNGEWEYLGLR